MSAVVAIRYQTLSLPPPYSYCYALELRPEDQAMQVRLDWRYTDRNELTDEEIDEEGFSADDDFSWEGSLPLVWKIALHELLHNTHWVPETASDNSALSVTVTESAGEEAIRSPHNHSEWEYFLQEAVQAIYEAAQRERPLRLAYLSSRGSGEPVELRWEANFLHRRFTLLRVRREPSPERSVAWQQLHPLLQAWYVPDYHPEKAEQDIPHRAGEYVDPGDGRWYRLGKAVTNPGKFDAIEQLRAAVRRFEMLPSGASP